MLTCVGKNMATGRQTLYIGLVEGNVERLVKGEPILLRGDSDVHGPLPGLEDWDVVVMGPSDTDAFVKHIEDGVADGKIEVGFREDLDDGRP